MLELNVLQLLSQIGERILLPMNCISGLPPRRKILVYRQSQLLVTEELTELEN